MEGEEEAESRTCVEMNLHNGESERVFYKSGIRESRETKCLIDGSRIR